MTAKLIEYLEMTKTLRQELKLEGTPIRKISHTQLLSPQLHMQIETKLKKANIYYKDNANRAKSIQLLAHNKESTHLKSSLLHTNCKVKRVSGGYLTYTTPQSPTPTPTPTATVFSKKLSRTRMSPYSERIQFPQLLGAHKSKPRFKRNHLYRTVYIEAIKNIYTALK